MKCLLRFVPALAVAAACGTQSKPASSFAAPRSAAGQASTMTLASSANPAAVGAPITFTASGIPLPPPPPAPEQPGPVAIYAWDASVYVNDVVSKLQSQGLTVTAHASDGDDMPAPSLAELQ